MTKKGALLINLGSPSSTSVSDVRDYLDEFLMDERVIDIPYFFRRLLVRGIILKTRPSRSSKAYQRIWTPEGSPLLVHTKKLQQKVQSKVDIPVVMAMRYGEPSILSGIDNLYQKGVRHMFLASLYPQYAKATVQTISALAKEIVREKYPDVTLSELPPFYNSSDYIGVLSKSISEHFTSGHLLFSYHGVPERHIRNTDPTGFHKGVRFSPGKYCCNVGSEQSKYCYRTQCYQTSESVAKALNINSSNYSISFQSRLGMDSWLKPYTSSTLAELPKRGIKKLWVVCPAFVADCIETIDEIGNEGRETFLKNGGESINLIPCLNHRDDWAEVVSGWINSWDKSSSNK